MKITTIGIDLAKEVFQIHGVDEHGKVLLRKRLSRGKMAKFFANIEPCLIGMEACGSSHHWARKLGEFGHTIKLMSPQFVKPYVKSNKNDMADPENGLPGTMRRLLTRLNEHLTDLSLQVEALELQIKLWHKENEASQRLEAIPGIGPITASAIVASVGNAAEFKNGRQFAAWFGLVPRQHSSGGKQVLLGISKRGDTYLRTLLVHGARAVIRFAGKKAEPESWLRQLIARRNKNIAAVALANKKAMSSNCVEPYSHGCVKNGC